MPIITLLRYCLRMYITDFQVSGSLTWGNKVTKKVLVTYSAPHALPCLESESLAVALAVKPSPSSGRGPHFSYVGPDFFTSEPLHAAIHLFICMPTVLITFLPNTIFLTICLSIPSNLPPRCFSAWNLFPAIMGCRLGQRGVH